MKICYCDETGTGEEPIAVMVGILVDVQRMHVTKDEWQSLLGDMSRIVGRPMAEIHTKDFYAGNGPWRGLPGPKRAEIISSVFQWIATRRHHLVYSSVEKATFYTSQKAGQIPTELSTLWRFLAFHLLLSVQRAHQRQAKTKGHTIFVFDNHEIDHKRFPDLIRNPPAWSDSYYEKGKKQARLDQVVDVPYFGDSEDVYLIQVADFVAYFLRRYAEIESGYSTEKYADEMGQLAAWISILKDRCIGGSAIYPSVGRCDVSEMFFSHAPRTIRELHRA